MPTLSERKSSVGATDEPAAKPTVLLVDDEPDVLSGLGRILNLHGYATDTASSIAEALARENWEDYAAGVFDRRLPDGLIEDALPAIRKLAPKMAIIIATGYADIDGTIKALRERVDDYLIKPVSPELLISRLGKIEEARKAKEEIQQLEREVIRSAEEEKRRIALEIHDGLGSLLGGVGMLARALGNTLEGEGMAKCVGQAREIERHILEGLKQARALSHGLYSVAKHSGGLSDSLREMASVFSEANGVECVCAWEGVFEVEDPIVSNHLFRIAQEAASNAIKHGAASVVRITLSNQQRHIELAISDNGRGFEDDGTPATGLGLRSMLYRCRSMNSSLVVDAIPGGGVQVCCAVPRSELR